MLEFTSVEFNNWLNQFFWPFVRMLALISTAPILNEREVNLRVKIGLALLSTLLIGPYLTITPVAIFSATGMWLLVKQMLVGVCIGFTMQLAFATFRFAGEVIGLQMGLSFATFFDPSGGPNMPILARILNLLAMLIFLAFNGHLWLISMLSDSFHVIPINTDAIDTNIFYSIARSGSLIFLNGLSLALPLITLLLAINLSLGLLNRITPQLSVFVIGFPVTLTVGILTIGLLMPLIPPFAEHLFSEMFDLIAALVTNFNL
ncbi:flagellar biosynthetic protein FliR [Pectobacteriaceae bacterium CE70]|nr:flagellar biosynthetic protein FliR [Pectobacteriaceae bacterium C52]WJV68620.1 flagellar biosynthetic protein FliR [Pectobacteriaceae bacterium CE70]WJY12549.1 flagellar biosynthetic protein FliR [Pectobacteriaceae bacterium C80]